MSSISRKIIVNNLILISLIMLVVGFIGFSWAEKQTRESSDVLFENKTEKYGQEMEQYIKNIQNTAYSMENLIFQNIDFTQLTKNGEYKIDYDFNKTIEDMMGNNTGIGSMYIIFDKKLIEDRNLYFYKQRYEDKIITPEGFSIYSHEYNQGNELDWYNELKITKADKWESVYFDEVMEKEVISFWHPFFYNGELIGVVGIDILVDTLIDFVANMEVYDSGYAFLLDDNYRYIIHNDLKGQNLEQIQNGKYKNIKELIDTKKIGITEVEYQNNDKKFGFFNLTNKYKLILVVPLKEIYSPIWNLFIQYVIGLIAIYIAAILAAYKSGKTISRPIIEMNYYIDMLEDGRYLVKLPDNLTKYKNEIGSLAITVNRMVEKINTDLERMMSQNEMLKKEVNERKRIEEKLNLMSEVIAKSKEGIFIADQNLYVLYINAAFTDISGYTEEDTLGKRLKLSPENNREILEREILDSLVEVGNWSGEIWQTRKNRDAYLQRISINSLDSGEGIKYIGIFEDETLLEEAEQNIDFLKNYDYLTNLPGKNLFLKTIESMIEIYAAKTEFFNLLMIGMDNFRIINEAMGHQTGDIVLKMASERILEEFDSKFVSRINGDEFAVIVEAMNYREIEIIIKTLNKKFLKPFIVDSKELIITCSIGVSTYPLDGIESEVLLRKAQIAMNHVKMHGKNNYQFYSEKMDGSNQNRLEVASYLRKALDENQFELYYQPIVSVRTSEIEGMEALIRWNHPKRGLVSPDEFIPIAEEMGLIDEIGYWVIKQAIEDSKEIKCNKENLFVAVNIASSQFESDQFIDRLIKMAQDSDFNLETLELEITERMLMDDIHKANRLLHELSLLGVSISIDDFGTGYSSLSYLKNFKVNKLKIDKIFMDEIIEDGEGRIAKIIVELGHGLGLKVVAEGVEYEEQLETLKEIACEYAQGYFISRPVRKSELINFINSEKTLLEM